jgi:hypothetical protein
MLAGGAAITATAAMMPDSATPLALLDLSKSDLIMFGQFG